MFTILHRDAKGTETLYSADRVDCVRSDDIFVDGIYLDAQPAPDTELLNQQLGIAAPSPKSLLVNPKHVIPFERKASSQDVCVPEVFVMNATGATVARYKL